MPRKDDIVVRHKAEIERLRAVVAEITAENLEDRAGQPCRVYEVLLEERSAICEYALQFAKIGYRKLTWMMVDAGIACVGESTLIPQLRMARGISDSGAFKRWLSNSGLEKRGHYVCDTPSIGN